MVVVAVVELLNVSVVEGNANIVLSDKLMTSGEKQVRIEDTVNEAVNQESDDDDGLTAAKDAGNQGNCN